MVLHLDMGIYVTARKLRDVLCFYGSFSALVIEICHALCLDACSHAVNVVEPSSMIHFRASKVRYFTLYILYYKVDYFLLPVHKLDQLECVSTYQKMRYFGLMLLIF